MISFSKKKLLDADITLYLKKDYACMIMLSEEHISKQG